MNKPLPNGKAMFVIMWMCSLNIKLTTIGGFLDFKFGW